MTTVILRYLMVVAVLLVSLGFRVLVLWGSEAPSFLPGLPRIVAYPNPLQVVHYAAFSVAWDARRQTPAWTAYHLPQHPGPVPRAPKRPARFLICTMVGSPVHEAYTGSGYDRGHLVPSHAIAVLHGRVAQRETFLTVNIAPQPPAQNQGPWMRLERKVFHWSQARGGLWVITGVVHINEDRLLSEEHPIAIPELWYVILMDAVEDDWVAKAVLISHDAPRDVAVLDHVTTIRALETLAGFDFNTALPVTVQDRIETVAAIWPLAPPPPVEPAEEHGVRALVDINSASAKTLLTLPGIGPILADRIIAGRPYENVADVLQLQGIGETVFSRLCNLVTVETVSPKTICSPGDSSSED